MHTVANSIFLQPIAHTFYTTSMQSVHSSQSSSGEPEISPAPRMHSQINENTFKVTPEDAEILAECLDDFRNGDTQEKNRILEKALGDLYSLRPDSVRATFEKREVKEVSTAAVNICKCLLKYVCFRK
jgi:hypothetical protein